MPHISGSIKPPQERFDMNLRLIRWSALALACLLATGCRERHEPVKPTVADAVTIAIGR